MTAAWFISCSTDMTQIERGFVEFVQQRYQK